MLFSMVSTFFQATFGAELDCIGEDTFLQCMYAIIRVLILSATFVVGQRAIQAKNNTERSMKSSTSFPRKAVARGHYQKKVSAASDDDLSTTAGSSDSESESFSGDDGEGDAFAPKMTISDLLRCRPAAGPAPVGNLRTMAVAERPIVCRQQFEQKRWENLRSGAAMQQPSLPAKSTSKIAPAKPLKSNSKPLKSASKVSCKAAPLPNGAVSKIADPATTAANAVRMQALLEIICPEDVPAAPTEKKATPPWRRAAAPSGMLPPGLCEEVVVS